MQASIQALKGKSAPEWLGIRLFEVFYMAQQSHITAIKGLTSITKHAKLLVQES
jgi:hypothetical protein